MGVENVLRRKDRRTEEDRREEVPEADVRQ